MDPNYFARPFYMDATEVTRAHYAIVMQQFPFPITSGTPAGYGYNRPAEGLTFFDALLYCNKRSELEGKRPVYKYSSASYDNNGRCTNLFNLEFIKNAPGYRLPTQQEWSYAYKAGVANRYFRGKNRLDNIAVEYAWFTKLGITDLNFFHPFWFSSGSTTKFVAGKKPNNCGLYDMAGNAHEFIWTESTDLYASAMGGAVDIEDIGYESIRSSLLKSGRANRYGFRVVRNQPQIGPALDILLLD